MNLKILLVGLGLAAALLLVLGGGLVAGSGEAQASGVGQPAPAFELSSVSGSTRLTTASLRGKPAVVNFWATWCPGCREEHQALQQAARAFAGRVGFLGISVDDDSGAVRKFLEEHGSAYPVALDRQSQTASAFGAVGVPQTFLLDARGTVVATVQGPVDAKQLSEILNALLGPAVAP
ncbi:MAG TPA: TlpA disulfide reductase family protein [Myxococcales bacterium]|jgi:cytochrome c biogenesis protein CcmG/thiol:disulfide interchange protein DsbE